MTTTSLAKIAKIIAAAVHLALAPNPATDVCVLYPDSQVCINVETGAETRTMEPDCDTDADCYEKCLAGNDPSDCEQY